MGGSRIFSWGSWGGGGNIMCASTHHDCKARSPLRPGSRARLIKGHGSSRVFFYASSLVLSEPYVCMHSDTKWDFKKHAPLKFLGGGGWAPAAPLAGSATQGRRSIFRMAGGGGGTKVRKVSTKRNRRAPLAKSQYKTARAAKMKIVYV